MASFTFNPLHQKQLFSITLCKCPSNPFNLHSSSLTFSPNTPTPLVVVRASVTHIDSKPTTTTDQEHLKNPTNYRARKESVSGYSSFRSKNRGLAKKSVENDISSIVGDILEKGVTKDGKTEKRLEFERRDEKGSSGFSSMRSKESVENRIGSVVEGILEKSQKKDGKTVKRLDFGKRVAKGSCGFPSKRSSDSNLAKKGSSDMGGTVVDEKVNKKLKKGDGNHLGEKKMEKSSKKRRIDSPEGNLRVGLDMCSKKGDVMGAIELYDSAQREGIKMGQYHYAVLLYLCSSAATGVVQPAKSGSSSRSLSVAGSNCEMSEGSGKFGETDERELGKNELNPQVSNESNRHGNNLARNTVKDDLSSSFNGKENLLQTSSGLSNGKDVIYGKEDKGIQVSVDVKKYALGKGFEIYEKMCLENVPMNEATLTSVARMAMSMGNGDMAFETVKKMKELGINPRLRSYGPALSVFCKSGDVDKAFTVEEHMLENGVYPEEQELEALLRVSVETGRKDKVYYLLHKLRTSVRKVLPITADLIEKWFKSKIASKVGKREWDKKLIREAIENGGGGWHGKGWLGEGKWNVSRSSVGNDGFCKCCGEKLATIDLDPIETENFAQSVASIAIQRERNSSFQKFQKWLDYYGPFEAVVDAANVGLFSQRKFRPTKVNAVVNGIRQMLPSKKWPLIVLHNRRITGENMDKPLNKALVEKWKTADALYSTPTGSNDDWYWLYAAIKFKCLLVTNDEMRDHLFQLLGNDFFPKWKERHQVRFDFSDTGPVFHMPPPCSVVIQESEKGHWHIPIASENNSEEGRSWLCITRPHLNRAGQASPTRHKEPVDSQIPHHKKGHGSSDMRADTHINQPAFYHGDHVKTKDPPQESYRNFRKAPSTPVFSDCSTILPAIEAAETLGSCVVDFQI